MIKPFILRQVSLQDQILLVKRLGLLLRAGVPMLSCLRMLSNQTVKLKIKTVLERLIKKVESGQSLSAGLLDFKNLFNPLIINLVQIGEISGTLQENLFYLEKELQKSLELRRKVRGALIYPAIIIVVTVLVSLFLTFFLFPKIVPIFSGLNYQLPWTTVMLIWLSTNVIKFWWLIILFGILFLAVFVSLYKNDSFRLRFDYFVLRTPLLGKLLQLYYLANICRAVSLMLKTDIRIQRIFETVSNSTTNLCYKKELQNLTLDLAQGRKISENLAKSTNLFPSIMSQMVGIGESTGNLSETFKFLSEIFENEVEDQVKTFSTIIEPLLMIIMGILVGFVALSIITPIYGFTQNIHL